ncbi:MAG: hypothetical protein WC683_08560 [bacterium]
MLSDERLKEIKARVQRATPGPWEVADRDDGSWRLVFGGHNAAYLGDAEDICPQCIANAALAAESRTDIPDLLDEVEHLRGVQMFDAAVADIADRFRGDNQVLRALLRQMEWQPYYSDDGDPPWYFCAICDKPREDGHSPNCDLALALGD